MKEIKKEEIEESWDKKKLFVFFLIIFIIAGSIYYTVSSFDIKTSVKGASEEIEKKEFQKPINLPAAFKNQLDSIKQNAASIDVTEVATSSPQVQKIINDIKALENYPGNQAKNFCQQICESF